MKTTKIKLLLVITILLGSMFTMVSIDGRICLHSVCGGTDPIDPEPDTTAPYVNIKSPANGGWVKDTVTIKVSASDSGSGIDYIKFYIDGSYKGTDHYSPYAISWDTSSYSQSSHTIKVIGYDNVGNYKIDQNTVYVDNTNPAVTISSPLSGELLSEVFTMSASASDSISSITKVKFYVDNTFITTDTTSTYSATIDPNSFSIGYHTLIAEAYDKAGNTKSDSQTVKFVEPTFITASIQSISITKGEDAIIPITFSNSGNEGTINYQLQIENSHSYVFEDYKIIVDGTITLGYKVSETVNVPISDIHQNSDGKTFVLTSHGNRIGDYDVSVYDVTNSRGIGYSYEGLKVSPNTGLAYALIAVDQDYDTKIKSIAGAPFSNTAEWFRWVYTSGARVFDEPTGLEELNEYGSYTEYNNGLEDLTNISVIPYVIPTYWIPDYSLDKASLWMDNLHNFVSNQLGLEGVLWNDQNRSHGFDFIVGFSADFDESVDKLWNATKVGNTRGKIILSSYYKDSELLKSKLILLHELGHLFGACDGCVEGESHHDDRGYLMYQSLASPLEYPYVGEWTPWLRKSIDTFDNILNYSWLS